MAMPDQPRMFISSLPTSCNCNVHNIQAYMLRYFPSKVVLYLADGVRGDVINDNL